MQTVTLHLPGTGWDKHRIRIRMAAAKEGGPGPKGQDGAEFWTKSDICPVKGVGRNVSVAGRGVTHRELVDSRTPGLRLYPRGHH